jgi:hypothetical protein
LKKGTKKLLFPVGCEPDKNPTAHKSFLLLFFKKEGLPYLSTATADTLL